MKADPHIWVSGFRLPADSVAAKMLATWKDAGGAYKDLLWAALAHYAATGEYRRDLAKLDVNAAKQFGKEAS